MINPPMLAQAYYLACMAEIEALKPGNVHIFADGHGMVMQDFVRSAEVSAPLMANAEFSLGERIFLSLEATWQAVQCNTNLGIILLCAPLIQAALETGFKQNGALNSTTISNIIQRSTVQDAQCVFNAIKLANPAGLGKAALHDVQAPAQGNLFECMQVSAEYDLIARQYCNGFADIFNDALPYYREALLRWNKPAWATTVLYLYFMANFPDSHVQRKYGLNLAQKLQAQAGEHLAKFLNHPNPKSYQTALMQFDQMLKADRINPGTSADLTVATLLTHAIISV